MWLYDPFKPLPPPKSYCLHLFCPVWATATWSKFVSIPSCLHDKLQRAENNTAHVVFAILTMPCHFVNCSVCQLVFAPATNPRCAIISFMVWPRDTRLRCWSPTTHFCHYGHVPRIRRQTSESRSFSFSGPSEFIASYFVQWPSSTPSGLATFVNSSCYWCPHLPIFSPFLSLFSFLPFLPCFAVDNAFQLLLTNDNAVSRVSSPLTNVYFSSSDHWVWKRILCAVGALSINI